MFEHSLLNLNTNTGATGVHVKGNVTESGTGTSIANQVIIPIQTSDVMVVIATSNVYTPDIPLFFCVHITKRDGGVLDTSRKSDLTLSLSVNNQESLYPLSDLVLTQGKTYCENYNDPKTSSDITIQAKLRDREEILYTAQTETVRVYKAGMTDELYPTAAVATHGVKVLLWDPVNNIPRDTIHGPALVSGSTATFKVFTKPATSAFPKLYYQVYSRGVQISDGDITPSTSSVMFSVTMTTTMTPEATVIVYGVTSENLVVVDTCKVKVAGALRNNATMAYNTQRAMVKDSVQLHLRAEPNSFVAIVAVDKGSLLLADPNDISNKKVTDYLDTLGRPVNNPDDFFGFWYSPPMTTTRMFEDAGVIVLSDGIISDEGQNNRVFPAIAEAAGGAGGVIMEKNNMDTVSDDGGASTDDNNVRKNFPETWIWLDSFTNSTGDFVHTDTLPDSITSWVTRAFVVSPTYGLGIPQNTEVEGFKPFFVTLEVPPRAIRGETFEIKLIVFNYLDSNSNVEAEVTMLDSDDYVMWKKENNDAVVPYGGEDQTFMETISVVSGGNAVIKMWIKPSVVGSLQFQVTARATSGGSTVTDTVIKTMNILPQGRPVSGSQSILVENGQVIGESNVPIVIDKNIAVPDSTRILVSRVGDIMGQALTNADKLLTIPSGCGEQNMITLVPNIFVLKYTKDIGSAGAMLTQKAEKNIAIGYQRELTYQHTDKSFSAFGNSDKSGSTWLTAFVVRSFAQAHSVMPNLVDINVISGAVSWLLKQYRVETGMFVEPGRVLHRDMQGGVDSTGEKLTAFVLISFVEAHDKFGDSIPYSIKTKLEANIASVTRFLESQYRNERLNKSDAFSMAMLAYALGAVDSSVTSDVIIDLNKLAYTKTEDGIIKEKCWQCDKQNNSAPPVAAKRRMGFIPPPPKPAPKGIETTAYAMLAYLKKEDTSGARPIMRWLNDQRTELGGYRSTQDTVMALFAMSEFSQKESPTPLNLGVTVSYVMENGTEKTYSFPTVDSTQEKLINRQHVLPSNTESVRIGASGTGYAVVTVSYKYNVPQGDESPDVEVIVNTWSDDGGETTYTQACVRYNGQDDSGMGLVTFQPATGHAFMGQQNLKDNLETVMRVDMSSEGELEVYMDKFTNTDQCLKVQQFPTITVADLQNVTVRATVYYEPDITKTVSYNLKMETGPPKCRGSTCGSSLPMIQLSVWIGTITLVLFCRYIH
nr:thioester-containing protein [Pinctada fucata]